MQPRLLLPLAAALVFAAPAVANAAVVPSVQGTTLTLTGDAAVDNITLTTDAAGKLALNGNSDLGGGQTLPSDGSITVVVKAGDGADNINLSAPNLKAATINGEAGDDIIVGSAAVDAIDGGDGNDRITGFKGNDNVLGGAGNDVMIWNNGDGTDVNDGGAGIDEVLVTAGNADDQMTVKTSASGFRFDRVNAPFGIDIVNDEKLSITSFSGNDTLVTDPGVTLPMTVDAGPGDDTITTGAGDDRLVGDRGNDTLNGGAGDDTLVWNNGDGSDAMNGDAGVDRVETNLSAGNDVSTLKNEAGRVRYDRTSAGAFSLSMGAVEVFELNALGGDDSLTTAADVTLPLDVDGGAGNDTLQGGSGSDTIDGGDGNDNIELRDGAADFGRGGPGADWVGADAVDAVSADAETVVRPAPQPSPKPLPAGAGVLAKTAKVSHGVASFKLSCPAGVSGCDGSVTLLRGKLELGHKVYSLKAGATTTLKFKIGKTRKVTARVSSRAGADRVVKYTLKY